MIIHNGIHEVLVDISEVQGWNEESQILHLCGFLYWVRRNLHLHSEKELVERFRKYLQSCAAEENEPIVK